MITSLPHPGHEHDPALLALLFLPAAVVLLFAAIEFLHGLRIAPASRIRAIYEGLAGSTQLGLLLVAMTAWIHFALAPAHWAEDPLRAILFVALGLGLMLTILLALYGVAWRPLALLLLGGSIAAYGFYVLTGREGVDAIGIFTKAIEAAALGLLLVGARSENSSVPSFPGPARTSNPSEVPSR